VLEQDRKLKERMAGQDRGRITADEEGKWVLRAPIASVGVWVVVARMRVWQMCVYVWVMWISILCFWLVANLSVAVFISTRSWAHDTRHFLDTTDHKTTRHARPTSFSTSSRHYIHEP
jgi:hypothetical protein